MRDFDHVCALCLYAITITAVLEPCAAQPQCQNEAINKVVTEFETLRTKTDNMQTLLQQLGGCPDGWVQYALSCYYYGTLPQTWTDSQDTCEQLGAHLATIGDADEEEWVAGIIAGRANYTGYYNDHAHHYVWLGGFDYLHEGQWVWVTGEPFSYANWRDPREAHNPAENCLDYSFSAFNDNNCTHMLHFICEKKSVLHI
jgi:hypothetical protein